jgi:hypothetical protein
MQQQTETRLSLWTIWSYEKEEQWINAQSERGLHLEWATLFTFTFRREPSARYTYRLDYRPDVRGQERLQEYLGLYADAGWEHTCAVAGWHYFRRPWQPGEQPVIYTDRSSLRQHYQTIQRTLAGGLSVELIIGVFNLSNIWNRTADYLFTGMGLSAAVFQGVITLLLAYGYAAMRRKIKAISVR